MDKFFFWILLGLALLMIFLAGCNYTLAGKAYLKCTDTDGGLNYSIKGTASGGGGSHTAQYYFDHGNMVIGNAASGGVSITDECAYCTQAEQDRCTPKPDYAVPSDCTQKCLKEAYCDTPSTVSTKLVQCANGMGCYEGACLPAK